eukprot:COSAG02_NODE_2564_length_8524_cov_19.738398_3_plen_73_part_00
MLSRVKTQGISSLIPEKTQRLEAATAAHCISQLFFSTPNDSTEITPSVLFIEGAAREHWSPHFEPPTLLTGG